MQIAEKFDAIAQMEDNQAMQLAFKRLTDKQRNIINAMQEPDMTIKKYSEEHKISYKTAYLHLHRGLDNLKRMIAYFYFDVLLPVQQDVFYFYAGIKKEHCQVNGIQPFLLSRIRKISFFKCQESGFILFSPVKDWGFCLRLRSTTTILYVYPLGSTLKNKDTTSYASSYNHGKRNKDRKKKL